MKESKLERVIERYKAGDARAFDIIYEQTNRSVYFAVLYIVRDKMHAEDILQETYIRAMRSLDRYEAGTNFIAWITRIVINECRNIQRSRMRVFPAERVAESGRGDVAALSSLPCASLYGLDVLSSCVQDRDNNYTRFACISRDLEIYPGADRTSLMIVLPHEPGSLYKLLAKFYALDINLLKLESRPIPERDFEFMFYFELDCPVAAPEFSSLVATIGGLCQECSRWGRARRASATPRSASLGAGSATAGPRSFTSRSARLPMPSSSSSPTSWRPSSGRARGAAST